MLRGDRAVVLLSLSLLERLTPTTVLIGKSIWEIKVVKNRIWCRREGREIVFGLVEVPFPEEASKSPAVDKGTSVDFLEADVERLLEVIAKEMVCGTLVHIDDNEWWIGLEEIGPMTLVLRCETYGDQIYFDVRIESFSAEES